MKNTALFFPVAGILFVVLLASCSTRESIITLNDVWRYSWVEEDISTISPDRSGTPYFVRGFFAAGDSGRAIKSRSAQLDIFSISECPKRVIIRLLVPKEGGTLRILHSDTDTLAAVSLDQGIQDVPVVLRPRHLGRGRISLRLDWLPVTRDYVASRLTIRSIEIAPNKPGDSLSKVRYDSTQQTVILDSGCAVRLYLMGGNRMSVSGEVTGLEGDGGILLGVNEGAPEPLWTVELDDRTREFSIELPETEHTDIVELILYARRSAPFIRFSNLEFAGFRQPDMDITDATRPAYSKGRNENPYNILLYVVDTVRRDRLTIYDYDKMTTPGLNRGKSEWVIWDNCRSLSSWTKAATATLLTGVDPVVHGAIDDDDVIAQSCELIWEPYHDAGYAVAFLSTNGHIAERWGFVRKVNHYRQFRELAVRREVHFPADSLHMAFLEWLDMRPSTEQPFFAYLHATDPHIPYTPDDEFIEQLYPRDIPPIRELTISSLAQMICPGITDEWQTLQASSLYDAEIAEWDAAFSDLIDELELRNLFERTIIIVTSDHGEEFHEHGGFSHGMTLYREQLDIPLIVRIPGTRGGRISTPMDHRDLIDLIHWISDGGDPYDWRPTPRTWGVSHLSLRGREIARLENRDFAFIWNISPQGLCDRPSPEFELYMNYSDEDMNIAPTYTILCRFMRVVLDEWVGKLSQGNREVSNLDPEMVERLRFLGYMTDE